MRLIVFALCFTVALLGAQRGRRLAFLTPKPCGLIAAYLQI